MEESRLQTSDLGETVLENVIIEEEEEEEEEEIEEEEEEEEEEEGTDLKLYFSHKINY